MLVKPEWLEVRGIEAVEIIVDRVDLLEEEVEGKKQWSSKGYGRDEVSRGKNVKRWEIEKSQQYKVQRRKDLCTKR